MTFSFFYLKCQLTFNIFIISFIARIHSNVCVMYHLQKTMESSNNENDFDLNEELSKLNMSLHESGIELWRIEEKCRREFFLLTI